MVAPVRFANAKSPTRVAIASTVQKNPWTYRTDLSALPWLLVKRHESNRPPLRYVRQLANGLEYSDDRRIVRVNTPLQLGELLREFLVRGQHLTQADECAHDVHAYFTARGLLRIVAAMMAPCSVKA
jgi:hypothetical protein